MRAFSWLLKECRLRAPLYSTAETKLPETKAKRYKVLATQQTFSCVSTLVVCDPAY